MMHTPAHKQTDPAKLPGQIVHPIGPWTTLPHNDPLTDRLNASFDERVRREQNPDLGETQP